MDWMYVAGGGAFVTGVLLWLIGGAWGRHQRGKSARRFAPSSSGTTAAYRRAAARAASQKPGP